MSWRCGGASNEELVTNLANASIVRPRRRPASRRRSVPLRLTLCSRPQIKDPRIIAAMKAVDRGAYCARGPYEDTPQVRFRQPRRCASASDR